MGEWYKKQDLYVCCLQGTHFRSKHTHRLKEKGWEKLSHANGNQKKDGVEILISDKGDFKAKTRDKDGHYIVIKGSIQQEDLTVVNIYALNIGAPKYLRQTLTVIKG